MSRAESPGADRPAAVSQRLPIWLAAATLGPGLLVACLYAGLGAGQGQVLAAIALTSAVACLAALLVARSIISAVEAATSKLRRFAAGAADVRLDSAAGFRQFRVLARTFNALAARVEERELQHALVSEATGDVIWKWSAATERVTWTGRVRSLFGVGTDHFEADSAWWHGRVHPKERDAVERRLAAAMSGRDTHWSDEYRFRHEDGSYRWFWDRGVILRSEDGAAQLFVGCMTDISEKRAAEERIWQLANNDELTGLPNRKVFQAELDSLVEAASGSTTLLLIDIDQFKDVNDSLGHAAGDALLRSVGARLKESVGESGTVFRLGGDEFAILLPGYAGARAEDLAGRLLSDLHRPMALFDRLFNARATIGIAAYP
ncbi:MAG TPA: diguanylate cyclase, partial [Afifellaceae bacterium]|nr:diguanylate cyclase [Afifellaceae bacterium]